MLCFFPEVLCYLPLGIFFAPRPPHFLSVIPFLPPSWIDGAYPLPCPPPFLSPALSLKHGLSEEYVALTLPLRAFPRNLECGFHLPTGVNAFTCPGKWLYIKNKIQVNILFWLSMIFNCWPSYTFIRVPPENPFPISPRRNLKPPGGSFPTQRFPSLPNESSPPCFPNIPPLYIIIMCPLGPLFFLLLKVCLKTGLSFSPLHVNLSFFEKKLPYIFALYW